MTVREQELAELSSLANAEAEATLAPAPVRRGPRLWDRRNRAA